MSIGYIPKKRKHIIRMRRARKKQARNIRRIQNNWIRTTLEHNLDDTGIFSTPKKSEKLKRFFKKFFLRLIRK